MLIQPKYLPELFLAKFGRIDNQYNLVRLIIEQESKATGWDAAIEHVLLQKDIQQPVLTHPAVPSGTHPQLKGD